MQAVEIFYSGKYVVKDCISLHENCNHIGANKDPISMIKSKFPSKIPIILERCSKERDLPDLGRKKFLVPEDLTLAYFQSIIRNRMKIGPTKALFFLINNHTIASLTQNMHKIYAEHKSMDGFLHITYASQDVFG